MIDLKTDSTLAFSELSQVIVDNLDNLKKEKSRIMFRVVIRFCYSRIAPVFENFDGIYSIKQSTFITKVMQITDTCNTLLKVSKVELDTGSGIKFQLKKNFLKNYFKKNLKKSFLYFFSDHNYNSNNNEFNFYNKNHVQNNNDI